MWYVIQTTSGNEHEVCLWINTFVGKNYYNRCFVPLFEDVWRKEGIGPLQSYEEKIVKLDLPHRRAIVDIQMLGANPSIKFPLWLDKDPLID